jgi:hypothetical protein
MTKNPEFDYNQFCLDGFRKKFPILYEADPKKVAEWLYVTVSAFNGRNGQCICGGGECDIHALICAVVSGTATVTVGDQTQIVRPNESTYIKMGEIHRLTNDGKIPVVLIEAQVGEYTGEDDIVRISDECNRV